MSYSSLKIEGNIISNNAIGSNIIINGGSNVTVLWNELYSPEFSENVFIGIGPVTTLFHYNNITTTATDGNRYFYLSGCPTDIDASYNWWGTTDTSVIDNNIWDYYDDITLGKVLYSPIASSPYDITEENSVSTPTPPSGPTSGTHGTSYTYSAGGSSSDHGHPLEYRFDWGDGTYSDWSSSASASKSWSSTGTYLIKTQARCEIHTSIVSTWSESLSVNISPLTYAIAGTVTYNGSGLSNVAMTLSGVVTGSTSTDSSGSYSFTGLSNGTYTVTPSKSGYTFTPTSRAVTLNGANQTGINFTAAISCTYTISPTNQSFDSSGGTGSVDVTTQSVCTWSATSNDSWITIISGSSGNGNGTVNYSVSANTATSQRTGTMTIAGKTFTVTQSGITCSYNISPTSQSFSSSGGTGSVSVTTQSGCTWTATNNVSWITVTSGNSGNGNGTVNYSVSPNECSNLRTGTMTIAGQLFTITQEGSLQSTSPTITVGTVTACNAGTQIEVPVTITDTADTLDCSFSVTFDKAKLQYAGKTSGDMGASVLVASTEDINATGIVQPIVTFEEGGATSGIICKFKFTLLSDISESSQLDLTIGDISPTTTYCGESGAVKCTGECSTWSDVIDKYNSYVGGQASWTDVITCYSQYAS